jgi:hypothetical protein
VFFLAEGAKVAETPDRAAQFDSGSGSLPARANRVNSAGSVDTTVNSSHCNVSNDMENGLHTRTEVTEVTSRNSDSRDISSQLTLSINEHNVNIQFSFLSWNVNGLLTKIHDNEFVRYIRSFDFVCLFETFVETFHYNLLTGYEVFCKPALKLSKQGRHSGGVVCLIKKDICKYVKQIITTVHNMFVFLCDKCIFGTEKDVLFVCTYIPPEGSPYYAYYDLDNGISLLEEFICDYLIDSDDVFILICGDLNSRTSNNFPVCQDRFDDFDFRLESLYRSKL